MSGQLLAVNKTADSKKKLFKEQMAGCLFAKAAVVDFADQTQNHCLKIIEARLAHRKQGGGKTITEVKQISENICMRQPFLIIILPYPQNKTPIGRKGIEKGRTMNRTRWDHNNISRYNIVRLPLDGNGNLSLKKKNKIRKNCDYGGRYPDSESLYNNKAQKNH